MTTKRTPGPWDREWVRVLLRYSRKQVGPWDDVREESEYGPEAPGVARHYYPDDDDADLVTAAPDLLEALEFMVDADGHIDACGNGGEDREDCSPGCCKVARALAKARGE